MLIKLPIINTQFHVNFHICWHMKNKTKKYSNGASLYNKCEPWVLGNLRACINYPWLEGISPLSLLISPCSLIKDNWSLMRMYEHFMLLLFILHIMDNTFFHWVALTDCCFNCSAEFCWRADCTTLCSMDMSITVILSSFKSTFGNNINRTKLPFIAL